MHAQDVYYLNTLMRKVHPDVYIHVLHEEDISVLQWPTVCESSDVCVRFVYRSAV